MQALAAHDVRCAAVRGVLLQAFQPVVRFCGSGAYENCELNLMQREREELKDYFFLFWGDEGILTGLLFVGKSWDGGS